MAITRKTQAPRGSSTPRKDTASISTAGKTSRKPFSVLTTQQRILDDIAAMRDVDKIPKSASTGHAAKKRRSSAVTVDQPSNGANTYLAPLV